MNDFISLYDAAATVTSGGAAAVASDYTVTVGSGNVGNCYVPTYPYPVQPTCPPTTIVNWPSYPTMHPHACPICEGRQTVAAGFYRDVAEDKGAQPCRACKGVGLIYLP